MTLSKIFFWLSIALILGIAGGSFFQIGKLFLLALVILGVFLTSVLWAQKKAVFFGFCVLFFSLGVWRFQLAESQIARSALSQLNNGDESVVLIGIVAKEPDIRDQTARLTIQPEALGVAGKIPLDFGGKVLAVVGKYPEYEYGDKLEITGRLEEPPVFAKKLAKEKEKPADPIGSEEGFNYRDYLRKDGIVSTMYFPQTKLLGRGEGGALAEIVFSLKSRFQQTARSFIPPPQEGFLEALAFGAENNISKEWKEKLNLTGTRHIAAVSGMNITIIASLILSFFLSLGFWRKQAFYFSLLLLALYILMIGVPASALRAGIMAGFLLAAQFSGRLALASRAVVFAGCLMLLANPFLLKSDIGFQLSFLAILGLIHVQPLFQNWLKALPDYRFFPLKTALSATLSAQVFTLPVLVFNFGYVSLASPLSNILIVPFLAPITILIFVFGLGGAIFWPLGLVLSFPVWLSLSYIIKVVGLFAGFSWAVLKIGSLHYFWLILYCFFAGFLVWRQAEKRKLKIFEY